VVVRISNYEEEAGPSANWRCLINGQVYRLLFSTRNQVAVPTLVEVTENRQLRVHRFPGLSSTSAPPEKRGFNGLIVSSRGVVIATSWDRVSWIDPVTMEILDSSTHPWFSDLHSVQELDAETLLISSTNLGAGLIVSGDTVRGAWSWDGWHLGSDELEGLDFRRLTKTESAHYGPHVAGVQVVGDLMFVALMLLGPSEAALRQGAEVIDLAPHGVPANELGAVLVYEASTGRPVRSILTGSVHEAAVDSIGRMLYFPEYFSNSLLLVDTAGCDANRIRLEVPEWSSGTTLTRGLLVRNGSVVVGHPVRRGAAFNPSLATYRLSSSGVAAHLNLESWMSVYAIVELPASRNGRATDV
jgi:hypothetical protein